MLSETTRRQVDELRDLLVSGTLRSLPRITIGDTVTVDAELAVRVVLANLDHLGQTDGTSPTRWGLIEEHIRRAHHAVAAVLER